MALAALGALSAVGCEAPAAGGFELLPRHFELRPGETIRYTPLKQSASGDLQSFDAVEFEAADPQVLELTDPRGIFQAVGPGRTSLGVKTGEAQQRYEIVVHGPALAAIEAVPFTEVDSIVGEEILLVGHANRDGFDHTAVAKPGVDRLVAEFKARGSPVVFLVSEEYPDWYTEDRQPDLAVVSEGGEHDILIDADRVVFTGGCFMFCLLRNVQSTLHELIRARTRDELHFVFPAAAIWMEDNWGPGPPRPYPAPMLRLGSLWAKSDSDLQRYEAVVIPFLDRLFTEYPVDGYPPDAPMPDLGTLIDGWNVEVAVGHTLRRTHRRADSPKTVLFEFREL